MKPVKAAHLAWARFQRRQVSMAGALGFEVKFFGGTSRSRWVKPFEYAIKAVRTLYWCLRNRPDEIWVQVPPVPSLSSVLGYRWLCGRRVRVVADCHNSMLRPPWSRWPGAVAALNRCDLVLVHNNAVVDTLAGLGVRRELIRVLEDAPATFSAGAMKPATAGPPRILFPASYSEDEPIPELLEAANLAGNITFVLTGDPARARGRFDLSDLPRNVRLTGYLSREAFENELLGADAVLALTRHDGIQLSVCNEAIGAGKPMVLSDTRLLNCLFGEIAVMVDSGHPEGLARGCREAIDNAPELSRRVLEFRERRWQRWMSGQATAVLGALRHPE